MISKLDAMRAEYALLAIEIDKAQDELVAEAKKIIGDEIPTQELLSEVATKIAKDHGIEPEYAIKVVECEIAFSMEMGIPIDPAHYERRG